MLHNGRSPTKHQRAENIWSAQLAGCLRDFLPESNKTAVMLTCDHGLEFKTRQQVYTGLPVTLSSCYPFHGSADVIIKGFTIVVDDEAIEVHSSGSETEAVMIENAEQPPKGSLQSWLEDLLANKHIFIVKKNFLRHSL